jgi:uncharacterized surface protein with fasciclin (FAS1) repeats
LAVCLASLCGGFGACTDDYDLDDEGNYPEWLGGSIYEALKNPGSLQGGAGQSVLTGTFNNYVRLIEDLGYAETLAKTGSKTVFPANDEAFARFFANNPWGVTSYEGLTNAMKKQLLYSSMLDNAILVEMLSNISDGATAVTQGQALKHTTTANVIDTITFLRTKDDMPSNNSYWEKYYDQGIHIVMDATRPMMVHFTEQQLTANNITTTAAEGEYSDFEVLTGTQFDAANPTAYVFRNKILNSDVTCKNGYIHQMEDVLVPPGNMAEVIRTSGESNLWSRMLDRFSAPYETTATKNNYNDYAVSVGLPTLDAVYQKRYMSSRSQGGELLKDPNDGDAAEVLPYDPGWNNYNNGTNENALKDIAAMFVPTDQALRQYFLPGGEGEFLINQFKRSDVPNDLAHLTENIDSIPLQNVKQLIGNLMQRSFVATVPSKFGHVMDEASDPMGLSLDVINRNADGTFDVKIANNGVVYMLNKMFAPPSLIAVSAPMTLNSNMRVMNEAVSDGRSGKSLGLGLNYYAYLLAMSANYAMFIPTDDAFQKYYIDPTSLLPGQQPQALKFYYTPRSPYVACSAWKYDVATNTVGDSINMVPAALFKSQLTDILNYHTIVLGDGEWLGSNGNRYYKTKHGGAVRIDIASDSLRVGDGVVSGLQIEGIAQPSAITHVYNQRNGVSYAIDHLIQAPQQSVLSSLQEPQFSEFLALCNDFSMDSIMAFASDKLVAVNQVTGKQRMDAYHTFVAKGGLTDNVSYFNTYNYTVYAPDNTAMQEAYDRGLPKWSDIKQIFDQYNYALEEQRASGAISPEVQNARDKALAMVEEINAFIRYHFQDNSVYADNVVEAGVYPTACSDTLGIREKLVVSGSAGKMQVKDKRGITVTIDASSTTKLVNKMARDYVFDKTPSISTSSFAVVHQISRPLSTHADTDRYDALWTGANATRKLSAFRRLFDQRLFKRY